MEQILREERKNIEYTSPRPSSKLDVVNEHAHNATHDTGIIYALISIDED